MPNENERGDGDTVMRETKVTREEHTVDANATHQSGLIDKLFDRMPSWQRSLLLLFIIPPMTLALSGVLLQVNVGGIMNRYIDYLFESAKQQTRDIEKIITEQVTESASELQSSIATGQEETAATLNEMRASIDAVVRELSASNARVEAIEKRVGGIETRVGKIERYICDSDKALGFGACALDQ